MKRRIFLILIIVVVILCVAAGLFWYSNRNQPPKLVARIELAIRAEKLDKAVELSHSYIMKYPDDWHGYYLQARAYIYLGQYAEARQLLNKLLEEKDRLKPDQVSTRFLLADTYALPAKRSLLLTVTTGKIATLKTAIEQLRQANKILSQTEVEDTKVALDLQQIVGMNMAGIGGALSRLSEQFSKQAKTVDKAGFESLRDEYLEQANVGFKEVQEVFSQAIENLLTVVTHDASRHDAAHTLVQMCIQQGDQESLQAAREAILSSEKPAPIASMILIVNDLEKSYKEPERQNAERKGKKEKVLQAAQKLDELLKQYPNVVPIKIQRASLALMLADLPTVERYISEILSENPRQGQARLIEAKMLLQRGELSEAENKLFSLKAEFLQWTEAHYIYAQTVSKLGKKELARQTMRRITELERDHSGARRYLAESLIRDGFYDQAFLDAKEYYESHPESPVSVKLFVTTAIHTDQPDLARHTLEKAKTDHGDNTVMLLVVTDGYETLGDKDNMLETLRLVADSEPTTVLGRLARARALVRIDRKAEAEIILLDELSQDPQNHRVSFVLGRIYADTGRNFQALEKYREALRLDYTNDEYRLAIARVQLEIGDFAECQQVLEEINSSNTNANLLRLQLRLIQGQPINSDEAIELMGFAGGLGVAMTFLQTGQFEECIHICQTELARKRDSAEVRMLLGQAYLALGKRDECVEQFKILLQRGPRKLSNYLLLARLLSYKTDPEGVSNTLGFIPGAQSYMIDLAMGWLFEHADNYTLALEAYDRTINNAGTPENTRNLARLFIGRTLAAKGNVDQAIVELDKISRDKISGNHIDLIKARLLVGTRNTDQANVLLETLGQKAIEIQDKTLLKKVVRFHLSLNQISEALKLCDEIQQIFPKDPEPHMLRASVLMAAGRRKETIECYRKAIDVQPGIFSISRLLVKALDDEQEPLQALAVLNDLESFGPSGRMAALFERGALFERWGLQTQAAECYKALAASGYGGNPKLQLFLGRTFAILGDKDQATEILGLIPEYVSEHLQAQLLRTRLTDNTEEKLNILHSLQAKNPTQVSVLIEIINTLLDAERADEALLVFRSFVQDYGMNLKIPAQLRLSALKAILRADDRQAAIDLSMDIAQQKDQGWWRQLAILLTMDEKPELTADLLPAVSKSNIHDALLGFCFAQQTNNANMVQEWFNRINQLNKQLAEIQTPQQILNSYKLCISIAMDTPEQVEAELARLTDSNSIDHIVASELVSYFLKTNDRSEAVKLLKGYLALDLGIPALSREWAFDLLKARPSFQWSASLAVASATDKVTMQEVLEFLEPKDCFLAKIINAEYSLKEKQYDKAAIIYTDLVTAGQGRVDLLLNQGIALENSGRLEEALEIYRRVWKSTNNPIAANNAAYVVLKLSSDNSERLAEAQELIEAAIKIVPNEPAFRDTKGWLAYLQGNYDQAGKELLWAVKRLPSSVEVHYHLGMTENALNHQELALWHLAAAVHIGQMQQREGTDMPTTDIKLIRLAQESMEKIEQIKP